MLADRLHPLGGDDREGEASRQLRSLGLGGGQHRGLLDEDARIGLLPARIEIEHGDAVRQVIEQRRQRRVEIGGVELDAREGAPGLQLFDLLVPVGTDVRPQRLQRHRLAQPVRGRSASAPAKQELASRMDRDARDRHHRALVHGVE